jgi:hypothetical protein
MDNSILDQEEFSDLNNSDSRPAGNYLVKYWAEMAYWSNLFAIFTAVYGIIVLCKSLISAYDSFEGSNFILNLATIISYLPSCIIPLVTAYFAHLFSRDLKVALKIQYQPILEFSFFRFRQYVLCLFIVGVLTLLGVLYEHYLMSTILNEKY